MLNVADRASKLRTKNQSLDLLKITGVLCERFFGVIETKALLEWVLERMGTYELEAANKDDTVKKFCCYGSREMGQELERSVRSREGCFVFLSKDKAMYSRNRKYDYAVEGRIVRKMF